MGKQAFSDSEIRKIYEDVEKHLDKTLCHIVQLLDRREQTVATGESCTGGLLSQSITSVAGASRVFELGLCTYANRMKERLLSVPAALLNAYGAVSAPVAAAMVQGLQVQSQADLCISVTGLAGPGGGTETLPVGTVYVGLLYQGQEQVVCLHLDQFGLQERNAIRNGVAICAFGMAEQLLMEE